MLKSPTMAVPAEVGGAGGSVGALVVVEVLERSGRDPPVQSLQPLLDGGVLQDLHLPRQQALQLHLTHRNQASAGSPAF